MAEVATFYMKRRSGMTLAAAALTSGLIASGMRAYLVVPTMNDFKNVPSHFPKERIRVASQHHLTDGGVEAYIFDDAERCLFEFDKHRGGHMVSCAKQRFYTFQDKHTRIYLFQYTI